MTNEQPGFDVEQLSSGEWRDLVEVANDVTPFVHPEWAAYQRSTIPGAQDASLVFRFDEGASAAVPLIEADGPMGTRMWWGMGMDEYGSVLSLRPLSADQYERVYAYLAERHTPIRLTLPPSASLSAVSVPSDWQTDESSTHILNLPETYEEWFNTESSTLCRRNIRRAEKSNLDVSDEKSPENIRRYVELYEISSERWGTSDGARHSHEFFVRLLDCPLTRLVMVSRNGVPASAMITLEFRDYVMYYLGASNRDLSEFRAPYLGLAHILRRAIADGHRVLNFGASLSVESLERFKEQFGAVRQGYTTYYLDNNRTRLKRLSRYYRSRLQSMLRQ